MKFKSPTLKVANVKILKLPFRNHKQKDISLYSEQYCQTYRFDKIYCCFYDATSKNSFVVRQYFLVFSIFTKDLSICFKAV